jgi:hypothetical protein
LPNNTATKVAPQHEFKKEVFMKLLITFILLLWANAGIAQVCNPNIIANAPDSRYTLNANGTAVDKKTNLTWMRCSLGQVWSNNTCTGSAQGYTWQGALQIADTTAFAGFSDWRLPNQKELQSLVENRCYDPSINVTAFPGTQSSWAWSSSPSANDSSSAWVVGFYYGGDDYGGKDYSYFVRLVRGGQ